jgi:hypothetical protein
MNTNPIQKNQQLQDLNRTYLPNELLQVALGYFRNNTKRENIVGQEKRTNPPKNT